ncbi:TDT family transporter [Actinorhabdospora filicis]|nr:TDT family transporter [Actinorhabdospora filicis]
MIDRFTHHIGPNWFASVMGTGIVANAAAGLPGAPGWLRPVAAVVWAAAAVWLLVLSVAFAAQWLSGRAGRHHADPVAVQFYGAPPMALLTVGAGALTFTGNVPVAFGLWLAGTVAGLVSAVAVPYLMFTRPALSGAAPFAGWLMPLVPPMVSAATGAALIPHVPDGQPRLTMLLACYAMFGLSLMATLVLLPQIWGRLAAHKLTAPVPTLWIVLGPLGQSATAAGNLGGVSGHPGLAALGTGYGVLVMGFALLWLALALAVTLRSLREGLPFTLTWWSFTFPVGTCVTGASVLSAHTGAVVYGWLAWALYAGLLGAWAVTAARTAHGLVTGALTPATAAVPSASHR